MSAFTQRIDALTSVSSPFVTFYDGDNRTELSGTTTANWVMKAANYLIEEHDDAARIFIGAPMHWQTVVWMMAAWRAGKATSITSGDLDILGVEQTPNKDETLVLSLHPFALPCPQPPSRGIDVNREVLSYPDALIIDPQPDETTVLCVESSLTHDTALELDHQPRMLLQASDVACEHIVRAITSGTGLVIVTNVDDIERIKNNENL